jgi:hypothetical protein
MSAELHRCLSDHEKYQKLVFSQKLATDIGGCGGLRQQSTQQQQRSLYLEQTDLDAGAVIMLIRMLELVPSF